MREIKFRAWDIEKKEMRFYGKEEPITIGELIPLNAYILMQYTGLKDKNGKEIYEGDIVYCAYTSNSGITGKVVFEMSCWGVRDFKGIWEGQLGNKNTIEIIGNIYENPELLVNRE